MNRTTSHDRQTIRGAASILAQLGRELGLGFFALGMIWGTSHALGRIGTNPSSTRIPVVFLDWLSIGLASGLVGRALAVGCALAATMYLERSERAARSSEMILALAARWVDASEQRVSLGPGRPEKEPRPGRSFEDRTRVPREIERALEAGRRAEAEALFEGFLAECPDDPAVEEMRGKLLAFRRRELDGQLAQIQAARQVNDPARVLELYRGVGSWMEDDHRRDVERELSRWFLEVIHRRLRVGRIQPDVVELATLVAETFGATMEGASLRASLPTLRRSVGLCPRCAQPYAGTDAACPRCVGTSTSTQPAPETREKSDAPHPEERADESTATPNGDRDDGGMFYEEDDGDDRPQPA